MPTVLVIDDDTIILELLTDYLARVGYRAVTATNGRDGLELFTAERPDIVLCDLKMPGLGGLEVLAEVRRRSPLTPFVVVSGTNDISTAVEALRQGAWDYLLKPLPGLDLLPPLLARLEERALLLREKELYQSHLEDQIKRRTAQLMRQLRDKDILLAEVHHRVKNNLQLILVLLGLQHDASADPQVREALEASRNRVHALAMVQEEMHDADHATQVSTVHYGTGLIHHLLVAHNLTARVNLNLEIDDLFLPPGRAFLAGLILNEWVTGLAQAGDSAEPWSLTLIWKALSRTTQELSLVESRGIWASWVSLRDGPSLGWELVSALVAQDGGTLVWDPECPQKITARFS